MPVNPKLLLHICCAPDSTAVFERLSAGYQVIGFFHNPNLYPETEYQKRLAEALRVGQTLGFPVIAPAYQPQGWYAAIRGLEAEPERGKRCEQCFRFNLEATARQARELGIPWFTTTLTISPHKSSSLILALGQAAGQAAGVQFVAMDFKKKEGFKRSLDLSKSLGLYRQHYCGCEFSLHASKR